MSTDPLIGRILNTYRIDRMIGRGGMARVFYAWDTALDRPAAVKVINMEQQQNPLYAKRIVQEAKAIARWRHENIVQVYHAGTDEGLYYFAMEYIEGWDLGHLLGQYAMDGELIPHDDLLNIGWAIARALDYAHEHGVIHRDIKPANVLLATDGRIVLADFGLALDVQAGTKGEVFGTPHYMSPEQAVSSGSAVAQSDLYSLGIILYEMLTGRVPFDDPSPVTLAVQHISAMLPMPTAINPDLSIATEAVLLKALSKEPQDRFKTGAALMKALERTLNEKHIPVSTEETPHKGISRTTLAEYIAQHAADHPDYPQMHAITERPTVASKPRLKIEVKRQPERQPETKPKPPRRRWHLIVLGAVFIALIAGVVWVLQPTFIANAPSSLQTENAAAVGTDEPTVTPTPTEVPTAPYSLILYYSARGFYLWNPGAWEVPVAPIVFEALDESGEPTQYRFEGESWRPLYQSVQPGHCDALLIENATTGSIPSNCMRLTASRTRASNSDLVFWLPREGITQFRVLWNNEEVARCEIAAGMCDIEVMVPVEN